MAAKIGHRQQDGRLVDRPLDGHRARRPSGTTRSASWGPRPRSRRTTSTTGRGWRSGTLFSSPCRESSTAIPAATTREIFPPGASKMSQYPPGPRNETAQDQRSKHGANVARLMITLKRATLVAAMIAAVAAVAVGASWDADREAARALGDFAAEQATLARALGAVVRVSGAADARQAVAALNAVPRPAETVVLVRRAGAGSFLGSDGREVEAGPVVDAFARGQTVARLSRPEAAALGLAGTHAPGPAWRASTAARRGAGRSPRSPPPSASAIANARRRRRLVGSVAVAAVLVLVFGGFAMREQRKELVLERELAVAALQQQRRRTASARQPDGGARNAGHRRGARDRDAPGRDRRPRRAAAAARRRRPDAPRGLGRDPRRRSSASTR